MNGRNQGSTVLVMAGLQQTLQTDQVVVPSALVLIIICSSTVSFMYTDYFNVSVDIGVASDGSGLHICLSAPIEVSAVQDPGVENK